MTKRWTELTAVSPSGKALFSCKSCGRISLVPDKTCPVAIAGTKNVGQQLINYRLEVPCAWWPLNADAYQRLVDGDLHGFIMGVLYTDDGGESINVEISEEVVEQLRLTKFEASTKVRGSYDE